MLADEDLRHYERINAQRSRRLSFYIGQLILMSGACGIVALLVTALLGAGEGIVRESLIWYLTLQLGFDVVREIVLRRREMMVLHYVTQQEATSGPKDSLQPKDGLG